jgi:hypothetical protein
VRLPSERDRTRSTVTPAQIDLHFVDETRLRHALRIRTAANEHSTVGAPPSNPALNLLGQVQERIKGFGV